MLEQGDVINGVYEIVSLIGDGGMSSVYLARAKGENSLFAVKEMRLTGAFNRSLVEKSLLTEIEALKALRHPGLVGIVDVVSGDTARHTGGGEGLSGADTLLFIMDHVEGVSLDHAAYMDIDEYTLADYALQLCDVLEYLHCRGVYYRDLKPSNVLIRPDGRVCLIDLGTVLMMSEKEGDPHIVGGVTDSLGTVGFAAPEQYGEGGHISAATDVFGLGRTLIWTAEEAGVGLSTVLMDILVRATRDNIDSRYKSAAHMYHDIRHMDERSPLCLFLSLSAIFLSAFSCGMAVYYIRLFFEEDPWYFYHMCAAVFSAFFIFRVFGVNRLFSRLTGMSSFFGVRRLKMAARVNGVLNIDLFSGEKKILSAEDIIIPEDTPLSDIRFSEDGKSVRFIHMEGFVLEKDVVIMEDGI